MAHTISYDSGMGCVILCIRGKITIEQIQGLAPQVAHMLQETNCRRLLNDMSAAVIEVSPVNLYRSPQIMDESGIMRDTRRALVLPADFRDARFLEDVPRNRGHNLMVFTDVEKAKEWLLS